MRSAVAEPLIAKIINCIISAKISINENINLESCRAGDRMDNPSQTHEVAPRSNKTTKNYI